jgi:hypothetical protein
MAQAKLFETDFVTARPANPIFCHQDFLEKLESHRHGPLARRAALLLQRLAVDETRLHYKSTRGENHGWRRSRLGGSGGSHFYAWWAPRMAAPLRNGGGFDETPPGSIFLRDIRHHDDHSLAGAQALEANYLPLTVKELRNEDFGPAPWTQGQSKFALSRGAVRVLKGHPGSGKTTALLHAADLTAVERLLYLTFSADLAALARGYFDRFCSAGKHFQVLTFPAFVRGLLGRDPGLATAPSAELRRGFRAALHPLQRQMGPWSDRAAALWDEAHAHWVGSAVPVATGRFPAVSEPHSDERSYKQRRSPAIGHPAASAAAELLQRLERSAPGTLADRYFPELGLAWQAAVAVKDGAIPPELLEADAIAVDECQDLTTLEASVIIELARLIGARRRNPIPVLWAGDEAQTVRPTDFEWAWLNDMLHHRLSTPVEFKLASNLRSPRRLAQLVNNVWDLYAEIHKRDRPSGSSYAEIDDDSADQIFHCTAAAGEELTALLTNLATREGLAVISLDDDLKSIPESARANVLTTAEAKGLDFHTVCLVDAGKRLHEIQQMTGTYDASGLTSIAKRTGIDQLRVALSRPTERLIWLDVNPSPTVVQAVQFFLNRATVDGRAVPCVPSAVTVALDEEALDVEERIQRCQTDARQYLPVKPDLAWSRAHQAVTLLGNRESVAAVTDQSVREAAHLTLAEICFALAMRRARLSNELGHPDLWMEARRGAQFAGRTGLANVIDAIGQVMRASMENRLEPLSHFVQAFSKYRDGIEPWVAVELEPKLGPWLDELEGAVSGGDNAVILNRILPPFYDAMRLPDAEARKAKLRQRSVALLMKNKRHQQVLDVLATLPEPQPETEAVCRQALGEFAKAAALFKQSGNRKEALACLRAIPDFDAAFELMKELGDHPAAGSYAWLVELQKVIARRPENFNRVMQASEKKLLEETLERALGVAKKKPVARKKAAGPVKKKAPAKRAVPRKREYF